MEQKFEITITGRERYTWQGRLCCGGETIPFRSEMELLLALDRLLLDSQAVPECGECTHTSLKTERGADQWSPT